MYVNIHGWESQHGYPGFMRTGYVCSLQCWVENHQFTVLSCMVPHSSTLRDFYSFQYFVMRLGPEQQYIGEVLEKCIQVQAQSHSQTTPPPVWTSGGGTSITCITAYRKIVLEDCVSEHLPGTLDFPTLNTISLCCKYCSADSVLLYMSTF